MRQVPTAALVVPWYERKYFEKMRLAGQSENLPPSYEAWLDDAFRDMCRRLKQGYAMTVVTIQLDDYLEWLTDKGTIDSVAEQTRYIEELAAVGNRWQISHY